MTEDLQDPEKPEDDTLGYSRENSKDRQFFENKKKLGGASGSAGRGTSPAKS